jgi:anti-anti-sigma regulatory factor
VAQLLYAAEADGEASLHIDLREVTLLDSTAIAVVIGARQRALGRRELTVDVGDGAARRVFEATGLMAMFGAGEA